MAWTSPMTAVFNVAFTAAQWNTYVRDNMNATEAALATANARHFAATGANAIAERVISQAVVLTSEGTASTSFTDLTTSGPAITVTTGTKALVFIGALVSNSTGDAGSHASYAVSGATTTAAADASGLFLDGVTAANANRITSVHLETLTAGSNTFTMKYRAVSGTATFADRAICVVAF